MGDRVLVSRVLISIVCVPRVELGISNSISICTSLIVGGINVVFIGLTG